MIIVDAFTHLGDCRVYEQSVAESEVVEALDANRVSAMVVSPFPGAPNPAQVHDQIADLGRRYPGRVFGLVNLNPHVDRDRIRREADRAVHQLGFVGLVLDTVGFAVNPLGQDARTIFELARELRVSVVVHTGSGGPFALPSMILPRARDYSDVKIILASNGPGIFVPEAHVVAREAANVYVEGSWSRGVDLKYLIDELGPSRVMFGSDLLSNEVAELAKYRALNLFSFQQHLVLGQAAVDAYSLQGVPDIPEPVSA